MMSHLNVLDQMRLGRERLDAFRTLEMMLLERDGGGGGVVALVFHAGDRVAVLVLVTGARPLPSAALLLEFAARLVRLFVLHDEHLVVELLLGETAPRLGQIGTHARVE